MSYVHSMRDRMPETMPDRMSESMPDRMPPKKSDTMPERMPAFISNMTHYMTHGMSKHGQVACRTLYKLKFQIECQNTRI